ncbi:protein preY, mitochondrial [Eublepharis macularius]|uniref:Protein preY, mitochondrial n=1 Tax=Eublepharis macularius TaxID=481883 RepID=A0AA97JVV1_EUBMA|nr:protein preY, mitochondrial [Eublepharis macularius]
MLASPAFRLLSRTRPGRRGGLQAAAGRALCAAAGEEERAGQGQQQRPPLEPGLLEILVCPLSKKPLRYEESTNELINEELGIAYPIIDGIPNMIPQAARMIGKENQGKESEQT